jgi:surface protein
LLTLLRRRGGFPPDALVVEFLTTGASQECMLPLKTNVNVTVDWGDGSAPEVFTSDDPSHVYAVAGSYVVVARGVAGLLGHTVAEALAATWLSRVQRVVQWGDLGLTSLTRLFRGLSGNTLTLPSDIPASVTSMADMFRGASAFNQHISGWNTSKVTSMAYMFYGASAFNQDISGWNTSKVTSMAGVFRGASAFNQDVSGWDTGEVTSMVAMFYDANQFNQDISGWNTSKVVSMAYMFDGANQFNQDISGWDYRALNAASRLDAFLSGATSFSPANYALLLAKWASYIPTSAIRADLRPTISSKYPSSAAADRAALITYGWDITDLGEDT